MKGKMHRRAFLSTSVCALGGAWANKAGAWTTKDGGVDRLLPIAADAAVNGKGIDRHRFGVNYTPSDNWWFCWNDWNAAPIERDLDAIRALGADHLRILLIWPYFQPNPQWISPAHLERLHQLIELMAERNLDAIVTIFTGQLSGLHFLPPFSTPSSSFYTGGEMWSAQEFFVRELARTIGHLENVIGFDLGNELNTCWKADPAVGDAWMAKMVPLMKTVFPNGLHVNGVDNEPWFQPTTFSARKLASAPLPVIHGYPYWSGALRYGGPMDPPSVKLLAAMATLVRSYSGDPGKLVWAEEFNTCIEALTPRQQAEWLERSVLSAMDAGVNWFTYWDSHDTNRKFAFDPVEYSLGLLTNDGKVKDQGRIFQELAKSYGGKLVAVPKSAPPAPPAQQTTDGTWEWMLDWMEWKPASSKWRSGTG
jgi:endo-1,4-beta-mannosidase